MVLEDLLRQDFKLADRKHPLDMKRAQLVLEKLAKYHAASAVAHDKDPKIIELYLESAINSVEENPMAIFFMISLQETLETIKRTPELQSYVKYLEKFDIVDREKKVFTRSADDKFHVLNHGDLWLNNIFISYGEEGEPIDTILVSKPNTMKL